MRKNLTFLVLFSFLILINFAGYFLRFYNLDTYFILMGFRFHLSIIFLFLLLLKYIDFSSVKKKFAHPEKQKIIPLLVFAFLPLLLVPLDMFILKEFKLSEKDYFFELGLSSIVDLPIYLIWNTPQLFIFFIIMNTIIQNKKNKFYKAALLTFFIFFYEIVPLTDFKDLSSFLEIDYLTVPNFILISLLTGLLISNIDNIYFFVLVSFTQLWCTILFFGSNSEMVINIILASQYQSWSGLVNPGKKFLISEYLLPFYLLALFFFSVFYLKKNS